MIMVLYYLYSTLKVHWLNNAINLVKSKKLKIIKIYLFFLIYILFIYILIRVTIKYKFVR
jgi:hypothetical protein